MAVLVSPGRRLAHEWGHTFGLGHTLGTLMGDWSAILWETLSPSDLKKARENARTAPYWR
jgi:hypothetical protein